MIDPAIGKKEKKNTTNTFRFRNPIQNDYENMDVFEITTSLLV